MTERGQLPLSWRWPARQRFEHFLVGSNALALAACVRVASEDSAPWVWFTGPAGSGKSHLLLAACQHARDSGRAAQYLSLAEADPEAVRSLGGTTLMALDDLGHLTHHPALQQAVFELYNRMCDEGGNMLFASRSALESLALPDLQSRLGACTRLAMRPLDEAQRRSLLHQSANARGIVLDEKVVDWLFRHHARDSASLQQLLERLDEASLAEQRRITVPFLRKLLAA